MDLRRAVEATSRYAGFFDFPLFPEEIHRWLICSKPIPLNQVLVHCPHQLSKKQLASRLSATLATEQKVALARKLTKILRLVPGIRMIAITGSVAAQNSRAGDDIDLFFITSSHTLWLVRPVALFLISLFFRRRYPGEDHRTATNAFCPNLWLDTTSITLPVDKRNLYTAHEVLQIVPLYDRANTYHSFLYQNRWVKKYLANAYQSVGIKSPKLTDSKLSLIFSPFNYLFYLIQRLYMKPKKTTETVHLHGAFLHTTDFASRIDQYLDKHQDI